MRRFCVFFLGCLTILSCTAVAAIEPAQLPTVVNINTFKDASHRKPVTQMKGFVWERNGYILSVYQKLLDPSSQKLLTEIEVYVSEHETWYAADIVGVEPTLNLSILKIATSKPLRVGKAVEYDQLEEGTPVFSPLDNHELEQGMLTTLSERECYQENMTSTMHISTIILPESSIGAPIVNQRGEVVAIYSGYQPPEAVATGISTPVSYLLPAFLATYIFDSLKYKKSMISPWTGFSVRRLTNKEMAHFPTAQGEKGGIAIEEVWGNSPADKLGIKRNDILLRFGHYQIESPADFQKWLYMYGVGHQVKLLILRNGKETIELNYNIEPRPNWAVPR